jgi:hypothetical protein
MAGRVDWVLSASHLAWSPGVARVMAGAEVVPSRTPGVVNVIA